MKRRLVGLLCGFIACLGWHMAQAGAQELEINLPVEFETLQIIMTDEQQTWLAGYTGEPMSSKPAVLQVTSEGKCVVLKRMQQIPPFSFHPLCRPTAGFFCALKMVPPARRKLW